MNGIRSFLWNEIRKFGMLRESKASLEQEHLHNWTWGLRRKTMKHVTIRMRTSRCKVLKCVPLCDLIEHINKSRKVHHKLFYIGLIDRYTSNLSITRTHRHSTHKNLLWIHQLLQALICYINNIANCVLLWCL